MKSLLLCLMRSKFLMFAGIVDQSECFQKLLWNYSANDALSAIIRARGGGGGGGRTPFYVTWREQREVQWSKVIKLKSISSDMKEAHLLWYMRPQICLSKSASLIFERGPFSSLVSLVKVQNWRFWAESLFGVLGLVLVMIRLGRNLSHCNQALYATQLALAWNDDITICITICITMYNKIIYKL